MQDLCDAAVRVELGASRAHVAKIAGVSKNTLVLYESAPGAVGDDTRAYLAGVYAELRQASVNIKERRKKRRPRSRKAR